MSLSSVVRTSPTVATLTLGYDNMDITANGTLSVTVLDAGHTRMGDVPAPALEITASAGTNVCGRTAQVREEIIDQSSATECTSVTDLATITTLDMNSQSISTLQSGDFAGLTGLTTLGLADNQITALPEDIFAGLTALQRLTFFRNRGLTTTTLPVGIFAGLTALANLDLSDSELTALPADIFDGRDNLRSLFLEDNDLSGLPDDIFAGLDSLANLVLFGNPFTAGTGLPDGVFDPVLGTLGDIAASGTSGFIVDATGRAAHFVCSRADSADIVTATTGVDDCLRITSAQLAAALAGLPTATLAASTPLTEATLNGAEVTVTLENTEYMDPLLAAYFMLVEDVEGDVTVSNVARTSPTVATLTLAHSGDILDDGELSMSVLAAGHTGTGDLPAGSVPITAALAVTGIAITSTGPYMQGEEIEATVTFSGNVTVVGVPEIALMVGANVRQATFASGGGSADLVFTYTVVAGETDANGVSINADALSLPAGVTIQNSGGDDAILTHTITVAEDTANAVDTTAPLFSSAAVNVNVLVLTYAEDLDMNSTPANGDYTIGLSAGTPPTVSGVTINGAEVTLALSAAVGSSLTATVTLTYVPGSTPLRDIAGNNAVALTAASVTNNTSSDPAASLTAPTPLTEANLNGATVTVTLVNTGYENPLGTGFTLTTEDVAGTVSLSGVARPSDTVAMLTLSYTGEAFIGDGTLSVTVLADSHTDAGDLTTNTVPITETPNSAPVAVIDEGSTLSVNAGAVVTLNGAGSSDPDGDMLAYAWQVVTDGVPALTLATTNLATLSFTAPTVTTADDYTIGLIVNDGTVDSPEVTIVVTVNPAGTNNAPVAVIDQGSTLAVQASTGVTLNSMGSNDPDGDTIATYAWRVVTNGVPELILTTVDQPSLSFTAPAVTTTAVDYTIGLVVNDGVLDSPEVRIVVTVNPPGANNAPVAVIDGSGTLSVNAGASVTLTSTGSNDPDVGDTIVAYTWRVVTDGVPALTLTTVDQPTLRFTAPAVTTADDYTIGLVVNDGTLFSEEAFVVVRVILATPGPTPEQTAVLHDEIAPQALQTVAGSVVASVGARIETTVQGVSTGGVRLDGQGMEGDGAAILLGFLDKAPEYTRSIKEGDLNWKRMLANSSFSLNAAGDGSTGGGLGVWGSGHYMEFNGDDNDLDWDGDSFSFQVGADTRWRNDLLTGIAVSWSEGDVEYSLGGADAERGDYVLTLTGIHPYLGWSSGDGRMSLWASAGYADGKIEIEPDEGVDREHDTTVVSVAGGFTRSLTDFLRIKGDFSGLEADIDEADEVPNDSDFSTDSQRLRLLLEGRYQQRLRGGGTLSQSIEAGYRLDEGDSEADTDGTEIGGSVDYHNPATGFSVSGKVRALVGNSNYQEWGVSGLIRLESGAQGLSFTLEPGYGDTAGSAGELWRRETPYLETGRQSYGARMKMHLGYGLHGGIMPYTEVTSGEALRSFRMGVKWQLGKALDLNLFGEQYEADESDNSLQLEGKLEF